MPLQQDDWVRAGLKALAASGIEHVRVERLARDLQVSKGSFYWHFKDRGELLEAMLLAWEQATQAVLDQTAAVESPREGVHRTFRLVTESINSRLDAAIHAWARKESRVAARVAAVEQQRIDHLKQLFTACGFPAEEAGRRAHLAYMVFLGWVDWGTRNPFSYPQADASARLLESLLLMPLAEPLK